MHAEGKGRVVALHRACHGCAVQGDVYRSLLKVRSACPVSWALPACWWHGGLGLHSCVQARSNPKS